MTAATHRLGGIAAGVIAVQLLPVNLTMEELAAVSLGSMAGCLFPDIDNARSSISNRLRILSHIISAGQAMIRGLTVFLPNQHKKYIRQLIGHRGIFHSLFLVLISYIVLLCAAKYCNLPIIRLFGYGVSVGMASHLLLDMFAGGVPLFSPVSTKRITLAHIKTGGAVEWLLRTGSVLAIAGGIVHLY